MISFVRLFFDRHPLAAHLLVQVAIFATALLLEHGFDLVERLAEWAERFEKYEVDVFVLYAPFGITYAIFAASQARRSATRDARRYEAARADDAASGLGSRYALDQAVLAIDASQRERHVLIAVRIENYNNFPRSELAVVERALFQRLVRQIQDAISHQIRAFRISNDSFALLFDTDFHANWQQTLEQTIAAINDPVVTAEASPFSAQLDFAVAAFDTHDRDAYRALTHTDAIFDDAWYCSQAGGVPSKYYDEAARERKAIRDEVVRVFHEQYMETSLVVHFQPVVDLRSWRVIGGEALVRLRSESLGLLTASEFLPVAQRHGLMRRIDWMAASAVAEALVRWPPGVYITLNLSRDSLQSDDHMRVICKKLTESRVDPGRIAIEVPEALGFDESERIRRGLQTIRDHGFALVIDGFGEAHGSLARLATVPAHGIKLSRALIADMQYSEKQCAVVASMIEMAHRLDLRVVAKGVETRQQTQLLKAMGCDRIQGFYISTALSLDEFLASLASHSASLAAAAHTSGFQKTPS